MKTTFDDPELFITSRYNERNDYLLAAFIKRYTTPFLKQTKIYIEEISNIIKYKIYEHTKKNRTLSGNFLYYISGW